jgi:hypothetical protein
LRHGSAARQIDHAGLCKFGAIRPLVLKTAYPVEHQGSDGKQGDDDQAAANAQQRLASPPRFRGFSPAAQHRDPHPWGFRT